MYVKRFQQKTLDCSEPVEEEVFINICLNGLIKEYRVFLETLSFPSFSKLMEAISCINESLCRNLWSTSTTRPNHPPMVQSVPRRRSIVAALNNKKKRD